MQIQGFGRLLLQVPTTTKAVRSFPQGGTFQNFLVIYQLQQGQAYYNEPAEGLAR